MADENIQTPQQPGQAKSGFLSTPSGKILMVVAALALLAIVVGVAAAVVLKVVLPQPVDEIRVPQQQQDSKPATQTGGGEQQAQPAPAVSYDEVFRFRDIFDPLIKPADETTTEPPPSETTTDTGDATDYAADTLYLVSITTGAPPTAVMVWDRQQYTLQEGDAIPDSPWRLLDIRTTSVVMLYGDQQVVLSVGQGIQK